jgi:uncharacterized phage protein (TIGR01671 family)
MREIKFKVWDTYKKIMDYTSLNVIIEFNDYTGCDIDDGELIFMQYTGLKDCKGKEIYEGDVVSAGEYFIGDNHYPKSISIVTYGEPKYFLKPIQKIHDGYINLWEAVNNYGSEVVGNIYENPELLENQ